MPGTVDLDELVDALRSVRRRRVLHALMRGDRVSVGATGTGGGDPEEVEPLAFDREVHFPKLEEYGFVEWHRDPHELRRGPNFGDLEPLLELDGGHEDDPPFLL